MQQHGPPYAPDGEVKHDNGGPQPAPPNQPAPTVVSGSAAGPRPPLLLAGDQHRTATHLGAWLQGIGSLLNVVFVLAVVDLARARHGFAGRLTLLAGSAIRYPPGSAPNHRAPDSSWFGVRQFCGRLVPLLLD